MTAMYHFESEQAATVRRQPAISTWAKPNGLGAVLVPLDCRGSEGR